MTVTVYTGANGSFALYEDAGVTYAYERGEFSTIPMRWNDATGVLDIGARQGRFPGMPGARTIHVRFVSGPDPDAGDFDAPAARTVQYAGQAMEVRR